jgi:exopolysaccharide biosynthesis polyprenyl glycosylphosphotransferase
MTNLPQIQFANNWILYLVELAGLSCVWLYFGLGLGRRAKAGLGLTSKAALPLVSDSPPTQGYSASGFETREKRVSPGSPEPELPKGPLQKGKRHRRETIESLLSIAAIGGDFAMIALGLLLATLIIESNFPKVSSASLLGPSLVHSYSLVVGFSMIALWGLRGKDLYVVKSLLFPNSSWPKLLASLSSSFLFLFGISLMLKTEIYQSTVFLVCAAFLAFVNVATWRLALSQFIRHPALYSLLRRRVLVVGGGPPTAKIKKGLDNSDLEFAGWVRTSHAELCGNEKSCLGALSELEEILHRHTIDVAVLTEPESLKHEEILTLEKVCENEHVQFKMVPRVFEILISGLRPEKIAGVDLLGVGSLPLSGCRNRFLKRTVDMLGALIGLSLAVPIMVVFGTLVYLESPGPILYKQIRQGRNGRLFYIYKIRSMHLNAEANGAAQWAKENDDRRLKIGAFSRRWNIDEVPQFWNVLVGDMSLVGPRPERPELIAGFKTKVPHYQARHLYLPGITGWAQVNGWRGNTDLEARIRHDIWYLENWSLWLDFQIMLRTFYCRRNAY